jgi:predicted transcriptional regulator
MHLREFLILTGEKPYLFAKRAKVRAATIYQIIKGNRMPPLLNYTMVKIVKAARGAVRLEDLT